MCRLGCTPFWITRVRNSPGLADIPVVMLTITDEKNLGYALGADEYLIKPIERQQLIETLGRLVSPVRERVET